MANTSVINEFREYIRENILHDNGIGIGMGEYHRAKKFLPDDLSADEYTEAVKVIADWCRV